MITVKVSDGKGVVLGLASVYRSGPNVGLSIVVPGPYREASTAIALDHTEIAELVSALVTVQAEVIAQN